MKTTFDIKQSEAYFITKPENVFYLSGFKGSSGFVIVTKDGMTLATDQRYWLMAKKVKKKGVRLFDLKHGWPEKMNEQLKEIKTIFFEESTMTVAGLDRWKKILPKRTWKKSQGVVEKMRLIKTDDELDMLRTAAQLGDKILNMVLKEIKPGVTEKALANLFRQYSDELADGVSFDPIVAFGENGASPHHKSGATKLKKNDSILIDQGVNYMGYMSDMTRCFQIGEGIPKVNQMHEQLLEAQQAGVSMVRARVNIKDLATAVRAMLGKNQKYFTHSLGHGVGVEIHEAPGVSSRSDVILEPGMVITIEPGLYKAGVGGVRIEDTVIVTEDGCEVITKSSKKTTL